MRGLLNKPEIMKNNVKTAPTVTLEVGMLPAATELPADVKAKVIAEAKKVDRTFAAQLRLIVKEWAARQPSA